MQYQPRNPYMQTSVQTANPAALLIMLYDGAIRFCRQGIEALKEQRNADAHTSLMKTQEIISEFIITLDRSNPVSESLLLLYDYFNHRLIEANTRKDAEPAEEVLGHLIDLKATWVEAAKQVNQMAGQANGSSFTATHSTVV
ncbi:flagellar export chaperone FliS [Paenibacillus sp. JDR-2]|uniref:flagellar export chaperone FliS n=1 Tax=Paenibacillus sp. (strain JDR-2) TaxID=324057 RepID=UPI0001667CF1|nr:flagellar export chaperone FliS [Paenibacillus sp. JDR-2]ACT04356.1 flagellar protein FliS [Paenibacillus sp. JDR-2]